MYLIDELGQHLFTLKILICKKGTDDLIVYLMSMGFELTDCQDAVTFGKISVEAAVEWLVAGKPGFKQQPVIDQTSPSLRLRQQTSAFDSTSSAFSKPVKIEENMPDLSSMSSTENTSQSHGILQESNSSEAVVSRLHLSDNQRKQKEGFEQKKRDEAKRKALLEKKRQKEDHARVLKEIAADREKKKLLHTTRDNNEPEMPPVKEMKVENIETVSTPSTSQSQGTKCLLQIRFPDGHSLRQSFNTAATLLDVWKFIQHHQPNMSGYIVIQPFPHHEFTEQEMSSTLEDLKLTPTGSLVIQKKQVNQSCEEIDLDQEDVISMPPRYPNSGPTPVPPSPEDEISPVYNIFSGQGHSLSDESVSANESDDMSDDDGPNNILPEVGNQAAAGMGLPAAFGGGGMNFPPPPGNLMGQVPDMFGMVGHGHQPAFGGVGQRLVSPAENHMDAPEEAEGLRQARERALQRAEARQAQPHRDNVAEPITHPQLPNSVPKLVSYCLKHVAHRLNDPRNQLQSLAGISEDMAQIILNYLIKEKLLKSKTLTPFIPCYLRQLILDTYPYTTNELLHAVRLHKNLSHLSLAACTLITDAGFQCISALKKLKHLNLSGCKQLTNRCSAVLSGLPNLVILNLEQTGFSDPGVINYLSSNPEHLTYLNLNRTGVTHAIISHLRSGAPQLRQLSLEDTQVESLLGIDQLPSLESLSVARTRILPESLFCLVNCQSLVSLNIANTERINGDTALQHLQGLGLHTLGLPSRHTTTDAGIQYLTNFQLHTLDLTNYIFVTDESMQYIGQMGSLRKLLLSNTKITDVGMVFLGGLSNLEVLDLERTVITDKGATIVKELAKLTELSFACTKITSRLLISGVLNNCSSLIKLNLSKTLITRRGILALALPFLEMLNLDGTKVGPDLTVSIVTGCPQLLQMTLRSLVPFTRDDEIEEAEMEVDS